MKWKKILQKRRYELVAPYTGAWIEIMFCTGDEIAGWVAPYTGAWIEISALSTSTSTAAVAPYTGAWIEIRKHGKNLRRNI